MTSEFGCISFIILLVTIITSSEVVASSLIAKYTICRKALCVHFVLNRTTETTLIDLRLYAGTAW